METKHTGKYKMTGLSKPASVTCLNEKTNDFFWAISTIPQDRFEALFKYFKGHGEWSQGDKFVILEYDQISDDGTPIDAKAIEFII